jgi:hypothetical protein
MEMQFHPPADTATRAWELYISLIRRMAPEQKLARVLDLNRRARAAREDAIRRANPHWRDRDVILFAAAKRFGEDLVRKAYSWSPPPC